jgi:hypothetical protein
MKFYTCNKYAPAIIIILAFLCSSITSINKAEERILSQSNIQNENEKHKKKSHLKNKQYHIHIPKINTTDSLMNATYRYLNTSSTPLETTKDYRDRNRNWDNKILDKQLERIATIMTYQNQEYQTIDSKRAFMSIFFNKFNDCDANKDNVLDLKEFTNCVKSDDYLYQLIPTPVQYAAFSNYTTNDTDYGYHSNLFQTLDSYRTNYLNFHDYAFLRLLAYSWRKCSVIAPFIEEVTFECAIEVVANYKTMSRNAVRRLFFMGLEIGNNESIRNLDFITYAILASSVRLYSDINLKEDTDITRAEFNLALDNNLLPSRYNQEVIQNFFTLIEDYDKPNQGIDMATFCFYDFILKIFDIPKPERKFHLSEKDFVKALSSYMFPNKTITEIKLIPQNKLSTNSYQQYTYLNLSKFNSEQDHFLKSFLEVEDKISDNWLTVSNNNTNFTFQSNTTFNFLFNIIDNDSDTWINYYDWASMVQILYLYGKFDEFNKGRIPAYELYEKYSTYSDLPAVSFRIRERSKRFNLLPKDILVDPETALLILKIDDIMASVIRRSDKNNIYEFELKKVLASVNLRFVYDKILNKCLRGMDDNKVPLYDWECAFINSVVESLRFEESAYAYVTTKNMNLTLSNTVFVNVDPAIA